MFPAAWDSKSVPLSSSTAKVINCDREGLLILVPQRHLNLRCTSHFPINCHRGRFVASRKILGPAVSRNARDFGNFPFGIPESFQQLPPTRIYPLCFDWLKSKTFRARRRVGSGSEGLASLLSNQAPSFVSKGLLLVRKSPSSFFCKTSLPKSLLA